MNESEIKLAEEEIWNTEKRIMDRPAIKTLDEAKIVSLERNLRKAIEKFLENSDTCRAAVLQQEYFAAMETFLEE